MARNDAGYSFPAIIPCPMMPYPMLIYFHISLDIYIIFWYISSVIKSDTTAH